ncbi:MAG: CHAP domain-containing protein [Bryobacteraceae bacterium]
MPRLVSTLLFFASLSIWAVGAFAQTNDYPFPDAPYCPASAIRCPANTEDPYGFYFRECTSFVAWRMNRDLGATDQNHPSFTNKMNGGQWGDAGNWSNNAGSLGYPVDNTPEVGAVAHWGPGECGGCKIGHVAYVESINPDGTVNVSEYNFCEHDCHNFDTRSNVVPKRFIHIVSHSKPNEVGYVDAAGDPNGVAVLIPGSTLYVRGWAADTIDGAPVQSVALYVDGASEGVATLGISRPDVAQVFQRSDYTNSGWTFQMSTASLSYGSHTVTAFATGSSGTGKLSASKMITIQSVVGQEAGYIDAAGDPNGVPTVTPGATLYISGWAADTVTGAPVQTVTLYVDGASEGTAILGGSRPDVAQVFGRSDFTNSGWTFQMSTASLSYGSHLVTAIAAGPSGTASLSASKTVTIQTDRYEGYLDHADCSNIYGWAYDSNQPDSPLNVNLFDNGNPLAIVDADQYRPDLVTAGKGNGYHGFSYAPNFADNQGHSITAQVADSTFTLVNSTTSFTCSASMYAVGAGSLNPQTWQDAFNRNNYATYAIVPTDNPVTSVGIGCIQYFKDNQSQQETDVLMQANCNGTVYGIYGGMWNKYAQIGGPTSSIGYLTNDRQSSTSSTNISYQWQTFQNSSGNQTELVQYNGNAFALYAGILGAWASQSYGSGQLALPTGDEQDLQPDWKIQYFQGGYIEYQLSTGYSSITYY